MGVRESYHTIELSPQAFAEIQERLVEAGYDWLVFPHNGSIVMDGFILQPADDEREAAA